MVEHKEIQTGSSIVTIGSVGVITSAFLLNQLFIIGKDWYVNPVTYFLVGGLLLIIAGSGLLLYYHDNDKKWALELYNPSFVVGLVLLVFSSIYTVILFFLFHL